MNKKGFTLVELVAVIAILTVVFGIAGYNVIGIINNSKKKSEKIFVDGISTYIDEYITLYGSSLVREGTNVYKFNKCVDSSCHDESEISAYEMKSINMKDLIDKNLVTENRFVNPVNKLDCLMGLRDDKIPVIRIFKDTDYVYYYYVDLRGGNTNCEISEENGIINTLPSDFSVGLE